MKKCRNCKGPASEVEREDYGPLCDACGAMADYRSSLDAILSTAIDMGQTKCATEHIKMVDRMRQSLQILALTAEYLQMRFGCTCAPVHDVRGRKVVGQAPCQMHKTAN